MPVSSSDLASLPTAQRSPLGGDPAHWWHALPDGRLQCDLCPRGCKLRPGQRGYCFVRQRVTSGNHLVELDRGSQRERSVATTAVDDRIVLATYGRNSGFALDPIEKKPLAHFYPATTALSFGTAGCNLGCKFCQNWTMSTAHSFDRVTEQASPSRVVEIAEQVGAASIAFTYNDPMIFAEYAIDTANLAREAGVHPVAVTAGYINPEPRAELFPAMDGTNIDLKAFDEDFYWRLTGGHLRNVLDTLVYVANETDTWLEVTTLVIPGFNDAPSELRAMCDWLVRELGPHVPLHLSAFHPDYKMRDVPPTPPATLQMAREVALEAGLQFVYTGNIFDPRGQSTYCPSCGNLLIGRDNYRIVAYHLDANGCCPDCGARLPGRFGANLGAGG